MRTACRWLPATEWTRAALPSGAALHAPPLPGHPCRCTSLTDTTFCQYANTMHNLQGQSRAMSEADKLQGGAVILLVHARKIDKCSSISGGRTCSSQ